VKSKTIVIPKAAFKKGQTSFQGKDIRVEFKSDTCFLWALNLKIKPQDTCTFALKVIPGALPVACCATEWDDSSGKPVYNGNVFIEVRSVQRTVGAVRVVVKNNSDYMVNVAIGIISAVE
jgi:hypothetical protein